MVKKISFGVAFVMAIAVVVLYLKVKERYENNPSFVTEVEIIADTTVYTYKVLDKKRAFQMHFSVGSNTDGFDYISINEKGAVTYCYLRKNPKKDLWKILKFEIGDDLLNDFIREFNSYKVFDEPKAFKDVNPSLRKGYWLLTVEIAGEYKEVFCYNNFPHFIQRINVFLQKNII